MAELVFIKDGDTRKVSDKNPLPVQITGNIDIGDVTIDNTDVVNAINNLRAVVELLETDIDSAATPTAPDLKTRVSQVVTAINTLQGVVTNLLTETQAIRGLIDNPSNTNDVFGRLDNVISSLSTVVARLESVRDILDGPTTNDVRGDLAGLNTLLSDVKTRLGLVNDNLGDVEAVLLNISDFAQSINNLFSDFLVSVFSFNFALNFSGSSPSVSQVFSSFTYFPADRLASLRVVCYDSAANGTRQIRVRLFGRYVASPVDSRTEVLLAESSLSSLSVLDYAVSMPFIEYRLEFVRADTTYNGYRYQIFAVRR